MIMSMIMIMIMIMIIIIIIIIIGPYGLAFISNIKKDDTYNG